MTNTRSEMDGLLLRLNVARMVLAEEEEEEEEARIVVSLLDVTEQKKAEEQLRLQSAALNAAANAIIITDCDGAIEWINLAFTTLTGYSAAEAIGKNPQELVKSGKHSPEFHKDLRDTILAGKVWHGESINRRKDGSLYNEEQTITPLRDTDGEISHFIAIKQDITERKRAEGEIRDARDAVLNMLEDLDKTARQVQSSEEQYRTLVENATELIWTLDREGRFTFFNQYAEQVSGYKLAEWIGKSFAPMIAPPEDLPRIQRIFRETLGGKNQSYDVGVFRADGGVFYLSVNTTPLYRDGQIVGTISFGRDVTAQKEAETAARERMTELTALFTVSSALRGAATSEEMLPIILWETIKVVSADTGAIFLVDQARGGLVAAATHGRLEAVRGLRLETGEGVCGYVAQTCAPYPFANLARDTYTGPRLRPLVEGVQGGVCVPLLIGTTLVGTLILGNEAPRIFRDDEVRLLTAIADMAASAIHRATLFEQLEHRVHELSTLFDVGKMVTASLHIEDVLDFIVGVASRTIHSEASYLFLWDEREERLVMRAVQGFPPQLVGQTKYRLGEGFSGWVFLEGRTVNASDVATDPRWKTEPDQEAPLPSGRIISALVVPLKVGEKTLGVLGVVNKIGAPAFTLEDESLLTTLASQMAIAIENARLYEGVRGLSTATIRSLATAIDARDPYTRGHSEEVTRLAVQVAREMGWSGADLELLEFAALLHDVGKIAVPDAILHKTEPLTPAEWNIIRMHPYHSAQIVKPVEPLNRLVPWIYHHQEKWDGTGYPDGLKGEAIPLAARIIAVVDAYNAMTTDRPYRRAMTRAQAIQELQRCAGKHFDPQIVQVFLRLVDLEKGK